MSNYMDEFRDYIILTGEELRKMDPLKIRMKYSPGKWSKKEILGHLIDSASINHKRFVEAAFKTDLLFDGYDQDDWVSLQNYQETPWDDLIALWLQLNLHIVRVMQSVPVHIRFRETDQHNFHLVAWQPVPQNTPATLDYFMKDYIGHLKHHMDQIFE